VIHGAAGYVGFRSLFEQVRKFGAEGPLHQIGRQLGAAEVVAVDDQIELRRGASRLPKAFLKNPACSLSILARVLAASSGWTCSNEARR